MKNDTSRNYERNALFNTPTRDVNRRYSVFLLFFLYINDRSLNSCKKRVFELYLSEFRAVAYGSFRFCFHLAPFFLLLHFITLLIIYYFTYSSRTTT